MSIKVKCIMAILGVAVTAGCTKGILKPQGGMASVAAVYSTSEIESLKDKAPSQSRKSSLFAASYEDVYRAVFVSASQTQINIETENKSKGLVLGTRDIETASMFRKCPAVPTGSLTRRYYYAIVVKEQGAKSTEVFATVKVQGSCWTDFCWDSGNVECNNYSTPHWADRSENPEKELTQLMTFIRNNLIAAGVL
mgnify:CR=1 FL=1